MKFKNIFSYDLLIGTIAAILSFFLLPSQIDNDFCKEAYFTGLTVLSIIFAIFFAGISIIMASTDDDFIRFLEKDNSYSKIIIAFRITLISLFISLIYSIALDIYSNYLISYKLSSQPKWLFLLFVFLASYSLIAVIISANETLTYSKYRTRFLIIKHKKE